MAIFCIEGRHDLIHGDIGDFVADEKAESVELPRRRELGKTLRRLAEWVVRRHKNGARQNAIAIRTVFSTFCSGEISLSAITPPPPWWKAATARPARRRSAPERMQGLGLSSRRLVERHSSLGVQVPTSERVLCFRLIKIDDDADVLGAVNPPIQRVQEASTLGMGARDTLNNVH
jgi:hypothetical protein